MSEALKAVLAERDAEFYRMQDECECNGCNAWAKSTPGSDERILALTSYARFVEIGRLYRTPKDFVELMKQWLELPDRTV